MSHRPFVFFKGYKERFHDLSNILSNVTASAVQNEWSNCMELNIEPVGWQAIWKMSRDLCTDWRTNFPCTVIVVVEQVNFKELSCLVSVNEVEDDNIHLPEKMTDVPLIELYPMMDQDKSSALSLHDTAQLIDSLRFFYNHLWMPWDLEFDEDSSWNESHLDGRLQLHFLMAERKVPHEVEYCVRRLVVEGRHIRKSIEHLQEQMDGGEDVGSQTLLQLTELHHRINQLRNQYHIYEKPELLKALIERTKATETEREQRSAVMLVLTTTSSQQLTRLTDVVAKRVAENQLIRVVPSLQEALVKAVSGECVWLTAGQHPVRDLASLETGGSVIGIEPGVTITDETEGCSTLDLLRGSLSITGITLHMATAWSIIKLRPSVECCLTEVRLVGSNMTDGIDVYPGVRLTAHNCHFSHCRKAVTCDTTSTVTLYNCTFDNNNIALEVTVGCHFTMVNCIISNSKLCGIHVLNTDIILADKMSIASINSIPQMKESGTVCKENAVDIQFQPVAGKYSNGENSMMAG